MISEAPPPSYPEAREVLQSRDNSAHKKERNDHKGHPSKMVRKKVKQQHHHPVLISHEQERDADWQLRLADAITQFAGSMPFVYFHAVGFVIWMLFVEKAPWSILTMTVSLEAIFLSTFVMIGQNRQAEFAQRKANHDFETQEQELKLNTELTQVIHDLTKEMHQHVMLSKN